MIKTIDDKLEVELTNHANEVFEPELTNDVDQILEEPSIIFASLII